MEGPVLLVLFLADKFHCPVTKKEFTENSHIVAIRTTGNVYSYDAVKQSNIIPKLWKDLMTGEDFTKDDILEIQNPQEMDRRKAAHFYFIKEGLALGSDSS
jgi:peptidyl-prolyl cis-trans isomerase-like protein 2